MVMGVSPILVVFGAIYHWYPKITGRMWNERLGQIHFWMTFLGTYAIYLPMHYLGILGVPRRYYALGNTEFLPQSVHTINAAITIAALVVAASVVIFLYNMIVSLWRGEKAPLEPVEGDVARVADARHAARARQLGTAPARGPPLGLRLQRPRARPDDFIPQNVPVDPKLGAGRDHGVHH
jgi:heme/copper-type cytochrome/quinol oxidase subunit 1